MSECAIPQQLHEIIQHEPDNLFPQIQLEACGNAGLFRPDVALSPIRLFQIASISVPTAFVLSQYRGAAERIARWSHNTTIKEQVFDGTAFATLGISQLSTSHQHTSPTLVAQKMKKGWRLKGFAPWVTGAHHAQYFILGAFWNDTKVLFCVHKDHVHICDAPNILALNQCDTTQVHIDSIVPFDSLLHIFGKESATNTGSLRSIAIAMGVTQQSISLITEQAKHRPELEETLVKLKKEQQQHLRSLINDDSDRIMLRLHVNQLALRSAQQALVVCKGKGFLVGEKAGMLCTQALFFLVWSCPKPVQYAHLEIGST